MKIPYYIIEDLRVSLGTDSDLIDKDAQIVSLSKKQILEHIFKFNGFNDNLEIIIPELLQLDSSQVDDYCDNSGLYGLEHYIKDILKM
jgi:hypothetical protein